MENITQIDLGQIDYKYAKEVIIERYEKAYSTVLFSPNYVFKIFSKENSIYDLRAVENEYDWDCTMPFLNPTLHRIVHPMGHHLNMLVLHKLPKQSNVLFRLINQKLVTNTIIEVGHEILNIEASYTRYSLSAFEVYENYISNVQVQLSFLDGFLSKELKNRINTIIASVMCKSAFLEQDRSISASIVHGNMFAGNIFLHSNKVIVIDPISINHVGRFSYPDIDIASYLVDLKILLSEGDYNFCFSKIVELLSQKRLYLIKYFFLLKLLVRIRFAYVELNLPNLAYETIMNHQIIKLGIGILSQYTNDLAVEHKLL